MNQNQEKKKRKKRREEEEIFNCFSLYSDFFTHQNSFYFSFFLLIEIHREINSIPTN